MNYAAENKLLTVLHVDTEKLQQINACDPPDKCNRWL